MCVCVCMCICMYVCVCVCVCIYIYIYIYIHRAHQMHFPDDMCPFHCDATFVPLRPVPLKINFIAMRGVLFVTRRSRAHNEAALLLRSVLTWFRV